MVAENSQNKEMQWLLSEKYDGAMTAEFERDCERLRAGEPLGYVIGFVPFLHTKIWLDLHPLIPRPETEYWVENALPEIQARVDAYYAQKDPALPRLNHIQRPFRILDLCAGSGCIGTAVARHTHDTYIDFAEIDARLHMTILKNIAENRIPLDHTHIFSGDLFEKSRGTYDVILSNPPYIDPELKNRIEPSVLAHEPHLALFGGRSGLECVVHIIEEAPHHLTPDGVLFIEHEPEHVDALHAYARRAGFVECATLPDQFGVLRTSRFAMTHTPVAQ